MPRLAAKEASQEQMTEEEQVPIAKLLLDLEQSLTGTQVAPLEESRSTVSFQSQNSTMRELHQQITRVDGRRRQRVFGGRFVNARHRRPRNTYSQEIGVAVNRKRHDTGEVV